MESVDVAGRGDKRSVVETKLAIMSLKFEIPNHAAKVLASKP